MIIVNVGNPSSSKTNSLRVVVLTFRIAFIALCYSCFIDFKETFTNLYSRIESRTWYMYVLLQEHNYYWLFFWKGFLKHVFGHLHCMLLKRTQYTYNTICGKDTVQVHITLTLYNDTSKGAIGWWTMYITIAPCINLHALLLVTVKVNFSRHVSLVIASIEILCNNYK